ncbi:MAG: hypothetical protein FWG72_05300 [Oscillospiraceae bacterium]|nr:hypothetical protein [Oscillospiraceae bacterium]
MIQKKPVIAAAALFVVMALTVGYFALADDIGGKENPLVTLDYIKILEPQIETLISQAVQEKVDAEEQRIRDRLADVLQETLVDLPLGGAGGGVNLDELLHNEEFLSRVVTAISENITAGAGPLEAFAVRVVVPAGGTLHLPEGSSVMRRTGAATVSAPSGVGLINLTEGSELGNGGSLAVNNLYTVTMAAGRDVRCSAESILFVWGPYIIR